MMKRILFLLLFLSLFVAACGGPAEEQETTAGTKDTIVEVFRTPT